MNVIFETPSRQFSVLERAVDFAHDKSKEFTGCWLFVIKKYSTFFAVEVQNENLEHAGWL